MGKRRKILKLHESEKVRRESKLALLVCLEFKTERLHGGTLRTYATYNSLIELGFKVEVIELREVVESQRISSIRRMKRFFFPLPFKNYRQTRRRIKALLREKDIDFVVCNWQPMMSACMKIEAQIWLDFMDDWHSVVMNEVNEKRGISKLTALLQGKIWRKRQLKYGKKNAFLSSAGYEDSKNLQSEFLPTPMQRKIKSLNEPGQTSNMSFRVGFIGNFNYAPNRLGVEMFLDDFNLEENRHLTFCIAGYSSESISDSYIRNFGEVEDVSRFYSNIDGVVCPIYTGAGIKVKAIEGLIHGFKVFATEHVISGFPEEFKDLFNQITELHTLGREELFRISRLSEIETNHVQEYFSNVNFVNKVKKLISYE